MNNITIGKTETYVQEAKHTCELIRKINNETETRLNAMRHNNREHQKKLENMMLRTMWLLGEHVY